MSLLMTILFLASGVFFQDKIPFDVQGKDGFKVTQRLPSALIFTRGEQPTPDLSQPKFIISFKNTSLSQEEYFTETKTNIALEYALDSLFIESLDTLKLAGLRALEFVGSGREAIYDRHVLVYRVLVFQGQQVFQLGSILYDSQTRKELPIFKEMSRTFRLTGAF